MIAFLDLSIGVSGDMLLGALLDAGLPLTTLQNALEALKLPGLRVEARPVTKNGVAAVQATVIAPEQERHRKLDDIETILRASELSGRVQEQSLSVFQRLAQAEARVHGTTIEQIHFHEVGALDAIADIVGVVAGFDALGLREIMASPIPLSHGVVRAEHGLLPVPPPAVLALCAGYPVRGLDIEGETVTPTGAALVTTLATRFGPPPSMRLQRVGHGAGEKDFALPNIVRLLLGEKESSASGLAPGREALILLETNIDDMNPEWLGPLLDDLIARGALDAWLQPIHMKKNRPATQLSVLCSPSQADALRAFLFVHTTTLGVRQSFVERQSLPRGVETVETAFGPIRLKVAEYAPGRRKAAPEYEDCRAASQRHGVPLAAVYAAAQQAWLLLSPPSPHDKTSS